MNCPYLPAATVAHVNSIAQGAMVVEGDVNGFWNAVLNHWFPTNAVANIIKAEFQHKNGFSDLLVTRMDYAHHPVTVTWRVIYEGKASGGDTLDRAEAQLLGYLGDLNRAQVCYVVAARGTKCKFWKFKKGDSKELKGIKVERGTVIIAEDGRFTSQEFDISGNMNEIHVVMAHMQANT